MNRCIGLNKNGKRCKTRINDIDRLICCESHKPLNDEILESCVMCCKEHLRSSEISTLNCGHCFHKECLNDFLELSDDKYSCPYCRKEGIKNKSKEIYRRRMLDSAEKYGIQGGKLYEILFV